MGQAAPRAPKRAPLGRVLWQVWSGIHWVGGGEPRPSGADSQLLELPNRPAAPLLPDRLQTRCLEIVPRVFASDQTSWLFGVGLVEEPAPVPSERLHETVHFTEESPRGVSLARLHAGPRAVFLPYTGHPSQGSSQAGEGWGVHGPESPDDCS